MIVNVIFDWISIPISATLNMLHMIFLLFRFNGNQASTPFTKDTTSVNKNL